MERCMVREYSRRIQIHLFCLFVCFFTSMNIHAQPKPEFINALWVAQEHNVLKISSASGQSLLQIPLIEETPKIAVDKSRGVVWLAGESNVFSYDFTGALQQQFPLPSSSDDDDSDDVNFVVNEEDGTLWLSKGDTIWHLTSSGQLLLSLQLNSEIEAVTLIPSTQHIWIATSNSIHVYQQADGVLVQKIALNSDVEVLVYDSGLKEVWLATEYNLFRYATNGISTYQQSFRDIEVIEPNGKGQVWIATEETLFYADISGAILFQLTPFSGENEKEIENLRSDPFEQSVWVGGEHGLIQVDTQGLIRQRIQLNSEIEDLAIYSEIIAPVLSFLLPTQSGYSNTATPVLSLQYSDNGIGTDSSTLKIDENGINLPVTCQHLINTSNCVTNSLLIEGLHTLDATVKDHAGNTSQKATTSFTVDTIAPAITINSHWNGSYVNQSTQALSGSLSEFATLDINGLPITLGLNHIFAYPVLLFEGQNNYLFTAKDQAMNVATFPFVLFLDSFPPAAAITSNIVVAEVTNGQSTITGQAGSVEADAIVEVTNLVTNVVTSTQANADADGSFSISIQANPNDKLNIVVIDKAGNRSAISVVQVPLPMSITITSPLDLTTVQGDSINIEGTYKGPENIGITVNGEVAAIINNKFYVNNVNLNSGLNTLTAYLSVPDGTTLNYAISVTSNATSAYNVNASPYSGMAPLTVNFNVNETQENSIQQVSVDFDSDGVVDYNSTDLTLPINYTYTLPGKYLATTTVVDINGVAHTYQNHIVVNDVKNINNKLRNLYQGMLNDLATGNISKAMLALSPTMRFKYETKFNKVKNFMPTIISRLGTIAGGSISSEFAEYIVLRNMNTKTYAYSIYFIRGNDDGIWRIAEM